MNALQAFETLIGNEKTYLPGPVSNVVEYYRPGHPTLRAVKTGLKTWELRVGKRVVGTTQRVR